MSPESGVSFNMNIITIKYNSLQTYLYIIAFVFERLKMRFVAYLFCGDLLERFSGTSIYNRIESRRNVMIPKEGGHLFIARYHSLILSSFSSNRVVIICYITLLFVGDFIFLPSSTARQKLAFLLHYKKCSDIFKLVKKIKLIF